MLLWIAIVGLAAPVTITWDHALAFEADREAYEARLRGLVDEAYEAQARAFEMALPRGLTVAVYTPAAYEQAFGADLARRSGAHYTRGTVNVNGGRRLDGRFSAVLHHEVVHAFVDFRRTAGFVPVWLNEGLAEAAEHRVRGEKEPAPSQWQQLRMLARDDKLPALVTRGHLDPLGYLLSWAAVCYLDAKGGEGAARNVVLAMIRDGKAFEDALNHAAMVDSNTFAKDLSKWIQER